LKRRAFFDFINSLYIGVSLCSLTVEYLFMKTLTWIALILLVVGGLNWGLVGLFEFDLVAAIFGEGSGLSRIVYTLVGLSAIYILFVSPRLLGRGADVV
jgi:uncharacterized protein